MLTPNPAEVRSDMLSTASTVQEILRALYLYGADYILLALGKHERLLHKDQLVALLEKGGDRVTLIEAMTLPLTEALAARMQMEEVATETPLLVFSQSSKGTTGELAKTTFGGYREHRVVEAAISLPEWWNVPLPLLFVDADHAALNESALELIPGGMRAIASQLDGDLEEKIITLKDADEDGDLTFSLYALTDDTYFIEDISGDFEMAEDLVWWAAIGRAFIKRMEENGLTVRRLSPYETPPENVAEVIPCSWEGELMGRLAIELPQGPVAEGAAEPMIAEAEPAAEFREAVPETLEEPETPEEPEQKPEKPAKAKSGAKKRSGAGRKQSGKRKEAAAEPAAAEKPETPDFWEDAELDLDVEEPVGIVLEENPEAVGEPKVPDSINKNAARKAYGGRGLAPAPAAAEKTKRPPAKDEDAEG